MEELISRLRQLPFPIDLKSLAEVEHQITEKMGADDFDALSHGTFIQFMSKCPSVIEALGGTAIGANMAADGERQSDQRQRVLHFINQISDKSDQVLRSY